MRKLPVVFDETVLLFHAIYINGGQRGVQILLVATEVARLSGALGADIVAGQPSTT